MENNEAYLGDGFYVKFDGYQFELRAENGFQTNLVYLEPQVYFAFKNFADKFFEQAKEDENIKW